MQQESMIKFPKVRFPTNGQNKHFGVFFLFLWVTNKVGKHSKEFLKQFQNSTCIYFNCNVHEQILTVLISCIRFHALLIVIKVHENWKKKYLPRSFISQRFAPNDIIIVSVLFHFVGVSKLRINTPTQLVRLMEI